MLISVWPIHIDALAYKADEGLCGKSMKILDPGPMQMESAGDWNTLTWSKGATIEGFAQIPWCYNLQLPFLVDSPFEIRKDEPGQAGVR